MAKKKKYPKKPKSSTSVATKQRYLDKVKEVDAYNAHLEREKKLSADLSAKIAKIGTAGSKPYKAPVRKKKKSAPTKKRKAVKKKR